MDYKTFPIVWQEAAGSKTSKISKNHICLSISLKNQHHPYISSTRRKTQPLATSKNPATDMPDTFPALSDLIPLTPPYRREPIPAICLILVKGRATLHHPAVGSYPAKPGENYNQIYSSITALKYVPIKSFEHFSIQLLINSLHIRAFSLLSFVSSYNDMLSIPCSLQYGIIFPSII